MSTPKGCVGGGRLRSSKRRNRRRRKNFKTRVSSRLSEGSLDRFDRSAQPDRHSSFNNPTYQGHPYSLFFFKKNIFFNFLFVLL